MSHSALRLFLLLMVLSEAALAGRGIFRHVNPAEVQEEGPSALELLSLYRAAIEAVASENYAEASLKLGEAIEVYAPPNVRYVINRFNELMSREVDLLNATHDYLILAKTLLKLGLLDEAELGVENGTYTLMKANITYAELVLASREVQRYLKIPKLVDQVEELSGVLRRYREELSGLRSLIEERKLEEVVRTRLSLEANATEVWVGSGLRVSGVLITAAGEPVPNREVAILLGGHVYRTSTDSSGQFDAEVQVPHLYKPEIKLYAVYTPSGDDVGRLAACRSSPVSIRLLYLTPNLNVSLDRRRVKPAESITLVGRSDAPGLDIVVEAFGQELRTRTRLDGSFELEFSVPEQAGEGWHNLTVRSLASGVYAPEEVSISVEVYRIPLEIRASSSRLAISGLVSAKVEGVVLAEGTPLGGVRVVVEGYGESYSAETDYLGRFSVEVRPGPAAMTGTHSITLTAVPSEPWYETASAEVEVLTLNLYATSLLVALGSLLLKRAWPVRGPAREEVRPEAPEPTAPTLARPTRPSELPEMYAVYQKAVEMVRAETGVDMRPSDTVREYLARTRGKLGAAAEPFSELSMMLEEVVYGGREPDLEKALLLLELIGSALEGESSA